MGLPAVAPAKGERQAQHRALMAEGWPTISLSAAAETQSDASAQSADS